MVNPVLEITLHNNRVLLSTPQAYYSDGCKYQPVLIFLKQIKPRLPQIRSVLVLGTGLASIVEIFQKKGFYPSFTLVDIDQTVLEWAMEFADTRHNNLDPVCMSAEDFMNANTLKFDIVFIDIFNGRTVPDFVTTVSFLCKCRAALHGGGSLGLNYIINNNEKWIGDKSNFSVVFQKYEIVNLGENRIFTVKT